MKTELRHFYAEETNLLRRMRSFGKSYSLDNLERGEKVTLLLLYRIFSNLNTTTLLTIMALKKGEISFYQLPIGIMLRCCFTDCLLALYLQKVDKEKACEELDLRTIEYANSLLERKEVYRDQVKTAGGMFDDDTIDHIWEMTMEDNFLDVLTFDGNQKKWL